MWYRLAKILIKSSRFGSRWIMPDGKEVPNFDEMHSEWISIHFEELPEPIKADLRELAKNEVTDIKNKTIELYRDLQKKRDEFQIAKRVAEERHPTEVPLSTRGDLSKMEDEVFDEEMRWKTSIQLVKVRDLPSILSRCGDECNNILFKHGWVRVGSYMDQLYYKCGARNESTFRLIRDDIARLQEELPKRTMISIEFRDGTMNAFSLGRYIEEGYSIGRSNKLAF